jgi:formiminotetrahydrofolate cyclodeaminase
VSDLGCAGEFAYAALLGCAYNVRINHKFMKDEALVAQQQRDLDDCESSAAPVLFSIRDAVNTSLTK